MTSFTSASWRWVRQLLSTGKSQDQYQTGKPVVLDGMSAIAVLESSVAESAALGASYPAAIAARAWMKQTCDQSANTFDHPLGKIDVTNPRAALAGASGMAMSGLRATTFLSGPDLGKAQDILRYAAGQHLPLVVHLASRASGSHAQSLGSGHETYHSIGESGWMEFFATNVQEAIDLALIARRVAERALIPGLVAMDGEQTATAAQDVLLPDDAFLKDYLGDSGDHIAPGTPSQHLLFGDSRRRLPRFYDLQRPMLLGSWQDPDTWAHGTIAHKPFFTDHLPDILRNAFEEFTHHTGRSYDAVRTSNLEGADIVLIAQGAAVETLEAVAQYVRAKSSLRVGVLGIRCYRPFPGPQIVELLRGVKSIAVLERTDSPLSGQGPLVREIQSAFNHALENHRFEPKAHPGFPALRSDDLPRISSVIYGLGGWPLRAADVEALIEELADSPRSQVYLGIDFEGKSQTYPKRQALLDGLKRDYPDLAQLSLSSQADSLDVRSESSLSIAVHRLSGGAGELLAGELAGLMQRSFGGHVRSRAGLTWQRFDQPCVDWIIHDANQIYDPGDEPTTDIAVLLNPQPNQPYSINHLVEGGALLVVHEQSDAGITDLLPASTIDMFIRKKVNVYVNATMAEDSDPDSRSSAFVVEQALGSVLAILNSSSESHSISENQAKDIREKMLAHIADRERSERLEQFAAAFTSLEKVDLSEVQTDLSKDAASTPIIPEYIRQRGRSDSTLDSLPRFWDQVGVLHRDGRHGELTPDPYLATGAIPALSSAFRRVSNPQDVILEFDPEDCVSDGRLWTSCPDGSIVPLVFSAKTLVETGIELASTHGKSADALRSVAGKIAKGVNNIIASEDDPPRYAEGLLRRAFDTLDIPEQRRESLAEALQIVIDEVGIIPMSPTIAFFADREREAKGSGEFLALMVNPDAGRNYEIMQAVGEGRGLRAEPRTEESVQHARRLWELWQAFPDTSSGTIQHASEQEKIGPLAAIMLSRHCQLAMAAGDGAEAGSGAKLALRHLLAVGEFAWQPRVIQQINDIQTLRGKLAEQIREVLADALPAKDLDALSEGLEVLGRDEIDLSHLSASVDTAVSGGRVDGARLGRLVDVARGLADLQWRLEKGIDGLGRSRTGLAITADSASAWAGVFPYNPFQNPVVIDATGETGSLALGLLEGQRRQVLAGFSYMRWAQLELDNPAEAEHSSDALTRLTFSDLDEHERQGCPPILIVGDGQSLGGRGLADLLFLLNTDLPVKVVILSGLGGDADSGLRVNVLGEYPAEQRFDLGLLAMLNRKAYVAQTSISNDAHFVSSVEKAMKFDGPALVHVHTPSPQQHGFSPASLFEQARLAVASRAYSLMQFDPSAEGVFGACLDLAGNGDPEQLWEMDETGSPLTPIHWAVTEQRFSDHFTPITPDDPIHTPIDAYLVLPTHERDGHTPFITVSEGNDSRQLKISADMIADAEHRLRLWRTLQELAGVVTPFTEQVRHKAEQYVRETHQKELASLQQEHEAKLADLKAQFDAEATQCITQQLMAIAGYTADGDETA